MTREQLILTLSQEYAARREENMRIYDERRMQACQQCPGLQEVLDARHAAVLQGVRTSLMNRFRKEGELLKGEAELRANGSVGANDNVKILTSCPSCSAPSKFP